MVCCPAIVYCFNLVLISCVERARAGGIGAQIVDRKSRNLQTKQSHTHAHTQRLHAIMNNNREQIGRIYGECFDYFFHQKLKRGKSLEVNYAVSRFRDDSQVTGNI